MIGWLAEHTVIKDEDTFSGRKHNLVSGGLPCTTINDGSNQNQSDIVGNTNIDGTVTGDWETNNNLSRYRTQKQPLTVDEVARLYSPDNCNVGDELGEQEGGVELVWILTY